MDPYFDLGRHSWKVTTSSPEAQLWFDRGLNWAYGFNHEEAVACFQNAVQADPALAMAHWGIAYAAGPFYNMPWMLFSADEAAEAVPFCYAAAQEAMRLRGGASALEAAVIEALAARFQSDQVVSQPEFDAWDGAYTDAMRLVYRAHPENLDVTALFAEALITRTPWKLWDVHQGRPAAGADTIEAKEVLETALKRIADESLPMHPAVAHIYIHTMEMSPTPEAALDAAHALRGLTPDCGHLHHMPGHIYVLCGMYADTITISDRAVEADNKYLDYAGPYNFYTTARCHDLHLLMYAAMLMGREGPARQAAEAICDTLTPDVLDPARPHMLITMEGYYSMKMHALVRFGRWREIVDHPLPVDPELYCVSTAMHHYAKGVAEAALGNIDGAERQRENFYAARGRVPEDRRFFNNAARDILAVGAAMLEGELAYRRGDHDVAFGHLRNAVHLDDNLFYTEPWAWMHPPRHALGALLLEQDRVGEAAAVYKADLGLDDTLPRCLQHHDNVWSLHGLVECMKRLGDEAGAAKLQPNLDRALELTDVKIAASCCCRTDVA